MKRLMTLATLTIGVCILPARGDVPTEVEKRIKQFTEEQEAIRKKAESEIATAREKLVRDLTVLKEGYQKAGKTDEAKLVEGMVTTLSRETDRTANLLVNGSFEEGPAPEGSGWITLGTDSTDLKGWKVTTGSIDHIGPFWKSYHGSRSLDLNGSEVGAVAQTFRTKKGQKYTVSFALSCNPGGQADTVKLKVSAAGRFEEFRFEKKEITRENMGWVFGFWDFTADSDETTIEFASLHTDEPLCGPALDDVIVIPAKK
jgi:choice-of-anchor C domain-containing protein